MVAIADYVDTLPPGTTYLFPSRKGDAHISTTQAYRIITDAGDKIGNNSVGSHTMRKTFGYTYYNATNDIATLMEIFNHSSQKTTLRYIGMTDERIKQSIKTFHSFNNTINSDSIRLLVVLLPPKPIRYNPPFCRLLLLHSIYKSSR